MRSGARLRLDFKRTKHHKKTFSGNELETVFWLVLHFQFNTVFSSSFDTRHRARDGAVVRRDPRACLGRRSIDPANPEGC